MKIQYLELLKKYKIPPNFACSKEYFERSKMEEFVEGEYVYWAENNWIVAPPINASTGELLTHFKGWNYQIWSSFQNWEPSSEYEKKFIDFEYIYDPRHFLNMIGGSWQVFRKNVRKFPGRYGKAPLRYLKVEGKDFENDIKDVFVEWLKSREENQEIYDDVTMTDFILNGDNRKILVDKDNRVLGINVFDSNYKFINFRFSITRNIKFLSEYIRYVFYTDPTILAQNKLVNDGGSLGNKNLEFFKDKLNPVSKRNVHSYVKKEM